MKRRELGTAPAGTVSSHTVSASAWYVIKCGTSKGTPASAPDGQWKVLTTQDVPDHVYMSGDGAADPASEPDDKPLAVPDGGDAVQRARHTGPIIATEISDGHLGGV